MLINKQDERRLVSVTVIASSRFLQWRQRRRWQKWRSAKQLRESQTDFVAENARLWRKAAIRAARLAEESSKF